MNIVKMGLKHEEKEEYSMSRQALKMYTVAFRMRRDAIWGKNVPSHLLYQAVLKPI